MKTNKYVKSMLFALALSMAIVMPSYGMDDLEELVDDLFIGDKKVKFYEGDIYQAVEKNDSAQIKEWLTNSSGYKLINRNYRINKKYIDVAWGQALCHAAEKGKKEIVELLLAAGVKVDVEDHKGRTPFLLASEYGHFEIMKLLLDVQTNINKQDCYGYTALMNVVSYNNYDIIQYLIEHGADHTLQKAIHHANDKTALDIARLDKKDSKIIQFLENLDRLIDPGCTHKPLDTKNKKEMAAFKEAENADIKGWKYREFKEKNIFTTLKNREKTFLKKFN